MAFRTLFLAHAPDADKDKHRIQVIGRSGRIVMTLLPGLMDIHSHIFLHPYNETLWNGQVLKEPLAYRTVRDVRLVMKGEVIYKRPA